MISAALLWVSIAGLVAACVSAVAARSLHSFSRHELEEICQSKQMPERFANILHDHERVALGVEMLVAIFVAFAMCSGVLWVWQSFTAVTSGPWLVFIVAAIVLGQIAAITTVWLPWSLARIGSARFLYVTWPFWSFVGVLTRPLVWAAGIFDEILHQAAGRKPQEQDEEAFEEEIRTIVSEGHREGLLEEEAREMIEGVMELGDAVVSHIMTPRTDIHMIQVDTDWDEIVESVIEWGHTRVPIYGTTRDEIVGILYSKDLLPELAKAGNQPPRSLPDMLRKPLFVPETKAVDDLLKLFQKSRTHIAVVLDEYGGVSGLVTIEDVLEEIVGEIDDEYDQKSEEEIRKIDDDVCVAVGRAHVDQINAVMDFDLPENEDFDTIGGFVFAEFGRVPAVGETITWQDSVRITVLEAARRRVNRVRLERVRKESLEIAQPS
ncbi:MAG TPA: hemolysin family protein [Lacipirellulaceae bacterium]|nr:hemolysin family protein [Lacipirellulaceae bacterium]